MKSPFASIHQKNYFFNTSWLLAEKVIRVITNFAVGVQVTRYLDVERVGILNYGIGYIALFMPIAALGLGDIIVREIVNANNKENEVLGTALVMRLLSALTVMLLVFSSLMLFEGKINYRLITIIVSFAVLFQSFDIFDRYFQAKLKSNISVKANLIANLSSSALKIIFVFLGLSLKYFAIAYVIDYLVIAFGLVVLFNKSGFNIFNLKFKPYLVKKFLSQSWPLVISGLMVVIYMRIDTLMIRGFYKNPDAQLGNFTTAVKLSEAFYFVPMVIITSLFPAIIYGKSLGEDVFNNRLQRLFDLFTWLAFPLALVTSLSATYIIHFLYGENFTEADDVLAIHIWASIFVFWGIATSKWYIVENMSKYITFNTALGCTVNIGLNIILIPRLGVKGAAISTVTAQGAAVFVSLLVFSKTRHLAIFMLRSFNIIRILKSLQSKYL